MKHFTEGYTETCRTNLTFVHISPLQLFVYTRDLAGNVNFKTLHSSFLIFRLTSQSMW